MKRLVLAVIVSAIAPAAFAQSCYTEVKAGPYAIGSAGECGGDSHTPAKATSRAEYEEGINRYILWCRTAAEAAKVCVIDKGYGNATDLITFLDTEANNCAAHFEAERSKYPGEFCSERVSTPAAPVEGNNLLDQLKAE